MYDETKLLTIRKQLVITSVMISGVTLIFLIAAISFMIEWPSWVGALFLAFGISFSIFLWGIYGTPVKAYRRFVYEIVTGRSREINGEVKKISDKPIYKDNKLFFYEVWIDDAAEERVLFYDANFGKPEMAVGNQYTYTIHENFIIKISK